MSTTYKLEVEFAAGAMTDVTSYLVRASFERSIGTLLDPIRSDRAMFEMDDVGGVFAPLRGSLVGPGKQVRFTAAYSGTTYPLFWGRATQVRNQPYVGDRQSSIIEAVNDAERIARLTLTTSLYQAINTASLFTEIMSRCAVASYAADQLLETVNFAWYKQRDAKNAINELVQSGNYFFYIDGAGTCHLKRPAWGFESVFPYVVIDYVDVDYTYTTDEFSSFFDLQYSLNDNRVYNDVKINSNPRRVATSVATVGVLNAPLMIPSSGAAGFWLTYQDPDYGNAPTPVASFQSQVASTDYYASVASDGTGADKTSTLSVRLTKFGETAVATVVNGTSGDVWLTRFNILGYPVRDTGYVGAQVDDFSSQAVYGLRSLVLDGNLIQDYSYLSSLATHVLSTHKNASPDLNVTLVNEFPFMLQREIGDSLAFVNSVTGVNSPWAIFGMRHSIDVSDGVRHQTEYELRYY